MYSSTVFISSMMAVAGELVLVQEVADLDLDELEELGVVDHVGLVQEHDDVGNADLAGEEDVLAGLGHRAVGRGDHEDRAVHLGGAGHHVLDVVGVPGAVDVRVVAVGGFVLDVRGVDGDAALALFGRVVDFTVGARGGAAGLGQDGGDCSRQGRLAVVNVTDRADVNVRFRPLEFRFRHDAFTPREIGLWTDVKKLGLRIIETRTGFGIGSDT
jgi:hypothetical protein